MDPSYAAALASDTGQPLTGIGIAMMVVGIAIVTVGALIEYGTGRPNIITRVLDRLSR